MAYALKTLPVQSVVRSLTSPIIPCPLAFPLQSLARRSFSHTPLLANVEKDTSDMVARILRVDHAGEFGADRIYAGQMLVLGKTEVGDVIQEMWDQEKEHKAKFEEMLPRYRVRPTALLPLWNVAGYGLGFVTALMGKEAAMACTVAVEDAISSHYSDQLRQLLEDCSRHPDDAEKHKELLDVIKKFRDDELDHHDTGLLHDAEKALGYNILTSVIKAGCKTAIYMSEKV